MSSTVWARRRERWAVYKAAKASADRQDALDAAYLAREAVFREGHREAIQDRGRDAVEDMKATRKDTA